MLQGPFGAEKSPSQALSQVTVAARETAEVMLLCGPSRKYRQFRPSPRTLWVQDWVRIWEHCPVDKAPVQMKEVPDKESRQSELQGLRHDSFVLIPLEAGVSIYTGSVQGPARCKAILRGPKAEVR